MCNTCKQSYFALSSLPGLSFWLHAFVGNVMLHGSFWLHAFVGNVRLHGSGFMRKLFPNITSLLLVAQMETICKESKSVNAGICCDFGFRA